MTEYKKLEQTLLKSRSTLASVCKELGIDIPDRDDLTASQCTQCSVWHYNYKMVEDLDGNYICTYCEDIYGL
jgi:hypothetical protein